MAEKTLADEVRELAFDNRNGAKLGIEEIAAMQPGLARLMPDVGNRVWKLYYAARARNWPLAKFQLKEAKKLLDLCGVTRPKYRGALDRFIERNVKPMMNALEAENLDEFEKEFGLAVDEANRYHEVYDKPFLRWKVPDTPPPDLDLTPR